MRLPRRSSESLKYSEEGDAMQHTRHINSVQWEQAVGYARQACARIFCDGGTPRAALTAFGLTPETADWSTAVERIALALCATSRATPRRKAA
jgi:hypothetical protein